MYDMMLASLYLLLEPHSLQPSAQSFHEYGIDLVLLFFHSCIAVPAETRTAISILMMHWDISLQAHLVEKRDQILPPNLAGEFVSLAPNDLPLLFHNRGKHCHTIHSNLTH